jgi:hypothetical protein
MLRSARILGAALLVLAASCGQESRLTGPPVPEAELNRSDGPVRLLQRDGQAPPFGRQLVQLRAVAGAEGEVVARFVDGTPVATFRVSAATLENAWLGEVPVQNGDTVVISMRLLDGIRYIVEMQPAGLVFNPEAPAELVFHYRNAARVRGGDLAVWKQEHAGAPWQFVGGTDDPATRTFRAAVDGFTRFAMSH